jgi:oligopeptide/dipeptide ABC transporter ATP-binding protein
MVFQDPLSSLNPVFTVGNQIAEMYRFHRSESKQLALKHAVEMMGDVGIPHAKERAADYPHQFSGGMRQRVMIAIALALKPSLLVADEPTTALDVTVQSEIIELIRGLCAERDMTLVLITHDLPVAAALCDHVAVMYAGRVVESGHIREVFDSPAHPYTDGLLHAIPDVSSRGSDLKTISGRPPNLLKVPSGCPFHVRCPLADEICKTDQPLPHLVSSGSEVEDHTTACHHADLILPSDEATRGEELT